MPQFIILVLALLLYCNPGFADALRVDASRLALSPNVEYIEDATGTLDISKIVASQNNPAFKWTAIDDEIVNFGYSKSTFWMRIPLHNPYVIDVERLLEIGYPLLDDVQIHLTSSNGIEHFEIGDKKPFAQRYIQHRLFLVPMRFSANTEYKCSSSPKARRNTLLSSGCGQVWSSVSWVRMPSRHK